ncbi:MAG: hypothetical protein R3B70_38495 [Polyangiaceae bacterium]
MKRTLLLAAALGLVAGLSACKKDEPSRWETSATATLSAAATPKIEGSKLNAFFPADNTDGHTRVFSQEKDGFVEAKLKKDGADVATLSISDASGDDAVKSKFEKSTDKVGDYPLVTVGKNQSAVLVNGKFQVKVSSPTLDPDARKAWLGKFDLAGLAKL